MKTKTPLTALLAALLLGLAPTGRAVNAPGVLNHQGRISVGGVNFDGAGYFKFALVKGALATETLWTNDGKGLGVPGAQPTAFVTTAVTRGHYAVLLGDSPMSPVPASVFANNAHVRLRIWFSTDSVTFNQLMPDRRITPSAYAYNATLAQALPDGAITTPMLGERAVAADKLAGGPSAGMMLLSNAQDGANWVFPLDNNASNELQTLSLSANTLSLSMGNSIPLPWERVGANNFGFPSDFYVGAGASADGVSEVLAIRGSAENWYLGVRNDGPAGNLFLGTSTAGTDGLLTVQPDGQVGIGTTTPQARLEVAGGPLLVRHGADLSLAGGGAAVFGTSGLNVGIDSNEIMARDSGAASTLHINREGGNVRIGGGSSSIQLGNSSAGGTNAQLLVDGDEDVVQVTEGRNLNLNLQDGGFLILGDLGGANLVADNNELQARNNGNASTLHLNAKGGNVEVGGGALTVRSSGAVEVGGALTAGILAANNSDVRFNGATNFGESVSFRAPVDENAAVFYDSGNNVIGGFADPGYLAETNLRAMWVFGDAFKTTGIFWSELSDQRFKKNIRNIENALNRLLKLRPVSFEYVDHPLVGDRPGRRRGMIAQEVEKVFPDWVNEGKSGVKSVNYGGLQALLVQALRELKEEKDAEIGHLSQENAELRKRLDALEAAIATMARRDPPETIGKGEGL